MPRIQPDQYFEDELDTPPGATLPIRAARKAKRSRSQTLNQPLLLENKRDSFDFSYRASRHERQWIEDSLGKFYESQWISDVLRVVKGGKEATVYQCLAHVSAQAGGYLAAKVYRPRQFRNLRKDHIYREGRTDLDDEGNEVLDHGMQNAMRKRSTYGLELLHQSWIEHEYKALMLLHAAGADVPQPYISGNNAILMEYAGGEDMPAPTLVSVELDRDEAGALFKRVLRNVEIMLANQRVHGDLSAYNILYWEEDIWLIDFPQVINPLENRNAYTIFSRDIRRVCEYFALQGVRTDPRRLAADLWSSYGYPLAPEVHPGLLDEEDERDRQYWQSLRQR